jgi:hypothetical protein
MTDCGDLVRFGNPSQDPDAAAFSTLAGTPTNPDAVTLVVERPDGTQLLFGWPIPGADGELTNESAGRFYAEVLINQSGVWEQRLAGGGAVTAAAEGTLRVSPRRVLAP